MLIIGQVAINVVHVERGTTVGASFGVYFHHPAFKVED